MTEGALGRTGGRFSATHNRRRLERRLASLRTLEWLNVMWLALILLWWVPARGDVDIPGQTWQRMLAYVLVAVMLVVGGWYWHRKLQQVRRGRSLDDALPVLDYFRVQLMHDTRSDLRRLWRTRRFRPSWLASDLAAWRRRQDPSSPAP